MRLHVPVLRVVQFAWLLEDAVRNGHLAHIMDHGRKSQLIATTKALRLINVVQGSPLVIHGYGTLGNALYMSTGFRWVTHLRGGDQAHDSAAHQIGAFHCKRGHTRKELQRSLVPRRKHRDVGRYFAATACVDQL